MSSSLPEERDISEWNLASPKHKSYLGLSPSPSSPQLNIIRGARRLSRSNTLPRTPSARSNIVNGRIRNPDIDDLVSDPAVIKNVQRWIKSIAIVDFDLDIGPVVSGVCLTTQLDDSVWENIAFAAFPDSLQFEQGAQVHSFRVRTSEGFLCGFSHFNQQRNTESKRGYRQRSVVLLTSHYYPSLYTTVVSTLGPLFEAHGPPMLESACQNIATWADPSPGSILEMGFLGSVFHVTIPMSEDEQQLASVHVSEAGCLNFDILASAPPTDPPPFLALEASISHLWSIWECLLLCEPILVFGMSPQQTSQAVWFLRDLVRPLPLAHDIRPYFVIQDQDYAGLVNKMRPQNGIVLGVTNPFFERACTHWPHVLSLGRSRTNSVKTLDIHPGPKPGWTTKTHKRYISKDRALLKQLEDTSSKISLHTKSEMIRAHFSSRTSSFLVPLNRYLNTLISPTGLKPFSTEDFIKRGLDGPLPWKSARGRKDFYERWARTNAFGTWIKERDESVRKVMQARV